MNILIYVLIFLFGTIIGSFLNVVIYRFNTGKSMVNGRSICMSCGHTLAWYELIPVLSFLFQKGKCRSCSDKISHQYPLVELATGLIFLLLANHFIYMISISFSAYVFALIYSMLIFSLLIVIAVYDIRHKVIPDRLVIVLGILSFLAMFVNNSGFGSLFALPNWSQVLAGPILALPFALIWFLSKGKFMGLGDAKIIVSIGWLLGLSAGLTSLVIAFWAGALVSLFILIFSRMKVTIKTEIPFAPFLVFSTLIVVLCHLNLYRLASLFAF